MYSSKKEPVSLWWSEEEFNIIKRAIALHGNLYAILHSSIIHNCPQMETIPRPINGWTHQQNTRAIPWNAAQQEREMNIRICHSMGNLGNIWLSERSQVRKTTYMTPFIGEVQKGQICRDRKESSGCLGLEVGMRNGCRQAQESFGGWQECSRTVLWWWWHDSVHYWESLNCMLKMGKFYGM